MRWWLVGVLVVFFFSPACAADGEVYGGMFANSTRRASPDWGTAKYIAGIEIGHRVLKSLRPYAKVETLMDWRDGATFHPASVEYEYGLEWFVVEGLSLKASHTCWHPVDSGGWVEEWDLVQIRYQFGR